MPNEHTVRIANAGDVDAIMALLVLPEVADAIRVLVHTSEHRAALRADVEECCAQPTSWVTFGSDAQSAAGFLIAKPKLINSHTRRTSPGLELRYGGVRAECRGSGVFKALLGAAMALGEPLYAIVKDGNKSEMARLLAKAGFVVWDPLYMMGNETAWGWLPPTAG
jgi:hypothetical protein